jgi:tricorn protease-like protein
MAKRSPQKLNRSWIPDLYSYNKQMLMKTFKSFLIIAMLFIAGGRIYGQQKGYYRYPAIHGNIVIFTAEDDLWKYTRY